MNNLSQECIEQIQQAIEVKFPLEDNENWDENMNEQGRVSFMDGARFALTNQKVYQAAGLMTVDECLRFAGWYAKSHWVLDINKNLWFISYSEKPTTTTELLTIFRNQATEIENL